MADVADADAASEAALSTVAASEASSDVDGVRTPRLLDGDGADADEAAAAVVSFDFFALPTELRLRILLYLEPRELAGLVRVCKRWRSLAHTNRIWWLHCMRHFWEPGDRPKRYRARAVAAPHSGGGARGLTLLGRNRIGTPWPRPVCRRWT